MIDGEALWAEVERMLAVSDLGGATPEEVARVMAVLRRVPREAFVPDELARHAFANEPLPIGHGQTISQPFIVALMTLLLRPRPGMRVLEVGTGSGYQAAVLAELVDSLYSLEVVAPLAELARDRLARMGYHNVAVRQGDGHRGWPEEAPFDGIIVTAAPGKVPLTLIDQLAPGGRLVIPVGERFLPQKLMLYEKGEGGEVHSRFMLSVAFVPMVEPRVSSERGRR